MIKAEIEVTPEMIEAGIRAHAGYNPEFDCLSEIVADIFCSMIASSPRPPSLCEPADGKRAWTPKQIAK